MKTLIIFLAIAQNFLLMQPIQNAIETGDFSKFSNICTNMLSINLEKPFLKSGYVKSENFSENLSIFLKNYKVDKTEWSSMQNLIKLNKEDDTYAVQSLNLFLRNLITKKKLVYKFVFFMQKEKGIEWKIYYLRGIRI